MKETIEEIIHASNVSDFWIFDSWINDFAKDHNLK